MHAPGHATYMLSAPAILEEKESILEKFKLEFYSDVYFPFITDFISNRKGKKQKGMWKSLTKNPNISMKLVYDHLEFPWNWLNITMNPNFTLDMIYQFKNVHFQQFDWCAISKHPNIQMSHVLNNLSLPWDWRNMSSNPNLNFDMVLKFIRNWDWKELSVHKSITISDVEKCPGAPWVWEKLSANPSLTALFIASHLDKDWDWCEISKHANIHPIDVMRYSGDEWRWDWSCLGMSINPNITTDFILACRHKPWNWGILSGWDGLTIQLVESLHHKPWNWNHLSSNINLSVDMMIHRADLPWKYFYISKHPKLTLDIIIKNIDRDWNWDCLTVNPAISVADIRSRRDLPWVWPSIVRNPTFDMNENDLLEYAENISLEELARHPRLTMKACETINGSWQDTSLAYATRFDADKDAYVQCCLRRRVLVALLDQCSSSCSNEEPEEPQEAKVEVFEGKQVENESTHTHSVADLVMRNEFIMSRMAVYV